MRINIYLLLVLVNIISLQALAELPLNVESVGSVDGTFSVTELGGASYNMKISCPQASGGQPPAIGLTYNSQSGCGLAGMKFNISGISAITMGAKNVFYDGERCPLTYSSIDAFLIDGQRLILDSGEWGRDGSVYQPEGNPSVTITMHGEYNESNTQCWFEVKAKDGMVYCYGKNDNARLTYTNGNGAKRISAWYISEQIDALGYRTEYEFYIDSNVAYPVNITYGKNDNTSGEMVNKLTFEYDDLDSYIQTQTIEDQPGGIRKKLREIIVLKNDLLFRKYELKYNFNQNIPLLNSIQVSNHKHECLPPTVFKWNQLASSEPKTPKAEIDLSSMLESTEEIDGVAMFQVADFNGDGISDIAEIYKSKFVVGDSYFSTGKCNVAIFLSKGAGQYEDPIVYRNVANIVNFAELKLDFLGTNVLDMDGDGIPDIIFPTYQSKEAPLKNEIHFEVILGKDVVAKKNDVSVVKRMSLVFEYVEDKPLLASADFNNDGFDELIVLGDKKINSGYWAFFVAYKDGSIYATPNRSFPLSAKPTRIYTGDFNNDILSDLIIFHENSVKEPGFSVFVNQCQDSLEDTFNYKIFHTEINRAYNPESVTPCDFNGDGLVDFLSTNNKGFTVLQNKGNGAFASLFVSDILDTNANERDILLPVDLNFDNKCDIVLLRNVDKEKSYAYWLSNNNNTLTVKKKVNLHNKDQVDVSRLAIGMFSKTGYTELMNIGQNLWHGDTQYEKDQMQFYSFGDFQSGKISEIKDGLGRVTSLFYTPFLKSEPIVPKKKYRYGAIPINVLWKSEAKCGQTIIASTTYKFDKLLNELTGRGIVGFDVNTRVNNLTGEKYSSTVTLRNDKLVPIQLSLQSTLDTCSTSVQVVYEDFFSGDNNYLILPSSKESIDYDGNVIKETYEYTAEGYLKNHLKQYGDKGVYEGIYYSNFVEVNGILKPGTKIIKKKSATDTKEFVSTTKFSYNNRGLLSSKIENENTSMELESKFGYDQFGNIISETTIGSGVQPIEKHYEFDSFGENLLKEYQIPAARILTKEYDVFGYVIADEDRTDPNNVLRTQYIRNGWGQIEETIYPDNSREKTAVKYANGGSDYSISKQYPTGSAETETWRGDGVLLSSSSYGINGLSVRTNYNYDSKNNLIKKETIYGDRQEYTIKTYDVRNRVLTEDAYFNGHPFGNRYRYEYFPLKIKEFRSSTANKEELVTIKEFNQLGQQLSVSSCGYKISKVYDSAGNLSGVLSVDNTMKFDYDAGGNCISVCDLPKRQQTYKYRADNNLLFHKDANGDSTVYSYDKLGMLKTIAMADRTMTYEYGTSGYDLLKLKSSSDGNNSIAFTHDRYGRLNSERRVFSDGHSLCFSYEYDDSTRLKNKTFPNNIQVCYKYDSYGHQTGVYIGEKMINKITSFSGCEFSQEYAGGFTLIDTQFPNSLTQKKGFYDKDGNEISILWINREGNTGLVINREGFRPDGMMERFEYDEQNRLVAAYNDLGDRDEFHYAPSGCITSKSNIGSYSYNNFISPYSVISVENNDKSISSGTIRTEFNSFGKIELLEDEATGYSLEIEYGPDERRWKSMLYRNSALVRTIRYAGEYEEIEENGLVRQFCYLEGGSVLLRTFEADELTDESILHMITDNQGSILKVIDTSGRVVFDSYYDAWGVQTIVSNEIGLLRGYTGQEMLPEFKLINMDGRLYDPVISQFLSPDNYIQQPDNPQSYNKYSYCLNNPLLYSDPSGELFGIDDFFIGLAGFAFGYISSGLNTGKWGWPSIQSGLMGAATGVLGLKFGGGEVCSLKNYFIGMGVNALTANFIKPMSFSISSNISIGAIPLIGFGSGGVSLGLGISGSVKLGEVELNGSFGSASNYYGWNASAKYKNYGLGFGNTYYYAGTFHNQTIEAQTIGIATVCFPEGYFSISNDLWGDGEDRWRTTSAELTIGKYCVGTLVDTNYGKEDSKIASNDNKPGIDNKTAPSPVGVNKNKGLGAWKVGIVYQSPIWVGVRQGSIITRLGYSHPQVQNLTQNLVHKYFGKANFYLNYDYFRQGMYVQKSNPNPFSLW